MGTKVCPAPARGATLLETAMVMGIAAIIFAAAIALGSEWISTVGQQSQGATVAEQRDTLRHAARSWYSNMFCRLQRDVGDPGSPPVELTLGVSDLRAYLPNGGLVREGERVASRWEIIVTREGLLSPQIHILWGPREGDPSAALARRTNARCDTDGDFAHPEACDDVSSGSDRLLWTSLLVEPTSQVSRTRRLWEWQQINWIDCDADGLDADGDGLADGNGQLDAYCDIDGDGRFGPYDADGDGTDDTTRFDTDGDGKLDLDVAGGQDGRGDLAVDIRDWHALGC